MAAPENRSLPVRKRPIHLLSPETHNQESIIFVTVCTHHRRPVLATDQVHELILSAWRASVNFSIGRYVLMPDHVHLFCAPAVFPAEPLPRWVSLWKSKSAVSWSGRAGASKLWQRDFWDRR